MDIAKEILRHLAEGWRSPLNSDLAQEMKEKAAQLSPPVNLPVKIYHPQTKKCFVRKSWLLFLMFYDDCRQNEDQWWLIVPSKGHKGYFNINFHSYPGLCIQLVRAGR